MLSQNSLKEIFLNLISKYSADKDYKENCWVVLRKFYGEKTRFYHNLDHIQNMINEFNEVSDKIKNPDVVLFAIFYHDIIYHPLKTDNENKSALFFKKAASFTNFQMVEECMEMIESSKQHEICSNQDCNFFLDFDLSILGKERNTYIVYCKNIRKEFFEVPENIFVKQRRKILTGFLNRDCIFHTAYFQKKYEEKSRENIRYELEFIL